MAQLASEGTLTRREVEIEFDVSKSTAKRIMRDLTEVGLIEFNRNSHPGFYQLVEG
jgi:predicted transcriptional regulator